MEKTIKVIPMYRTEDYYRNEERFRGECEEQCICCGRKLNPKTMKMAQAIEPGYFVDTTVGQIPDIVNENTHQVSMGWYPVGPICYREIRRRLAQSTETVVVEM